MSKIFKNSSQEFWDERTHTNHMILSKILYFNSFLFVVLWCDVWIKLQPWIKYKKQENFIKMSNLISSYCVLGITIKKPQRLSVKSTQMICKHFTILLSLFLFLVSSCSAFTFFLKSSFRVEIIQKIYLA
jgi:hypothetical protein